MHQAALTGLDMPHRQPILHASKPQPPALGIEGRGIEHHRAIPAAPHGHGFAAQHGPATRAAAEVREQTRRGGREGGVPEREGVVVVGRVRVVERAGGGVVAFAGGE